MPEKVKILYSPGFGAGFSTWITNVPQKWLCQYKPLIEAVEAGQAISEEHSACKQLVEDIKKTFGEEVGSYVCLLGVVDLKIYEVDKGAQVRVTEYDGFESVEIGYSEFWEAG